MCLCHIQLQDTPHTLSKGAIVPPLDVMKLNGEMMPLATVLDGKPTLLLSCFRESGRLLITKWADAYEKHKERHNSIRIIQLCIYQELYLRMFKNTTLKGLDHVTIKHRKENTFAYFGAPQV